MIFPVTASPCLSIHLSAKINFSKRNYLSANRNRSLSNPTTGLPSMTTSGRRNRRGSRTISVINSSSDNFSAASPIFLYDGLLVDMTSCAVSLIDFNSARNSSMVNACLKKSRASYAMCFCARNSSAWRQVDQVERRYISTLCFDILFPNFQLMLRNVISRGARNLGV